MSTPVTLTPTPTPSDPSLCPNPDKVKFMNRTAAETFEQNHRNQNGQQYVYECPGCGKFHLSSNSSDTDSRTGNIVGGPVTRTSSSWMGAAVVPKQTQTDKVLNALTRYGNSRTAKEISEELNCDVQLVYSVSRSEGISFKPGRGTPEVAIARVQSLGSLAIRKAQMLADMAELVAQEEKLKLEAKARDEKLRLEAIEQKKAKLRMSDTGNSVIISASGREIALSLEQYGQIVAAVQTFVVKRAA